VVEFTCLFYVILWLYGQKAALKERIDNVVTLTVAWYLAHWTLTNVFHWFKQCLQGKKILKRN